MFRSLSAGSPQDKADRRRPIRLGAALIAVLGMLLGPLALAASAATTPHATTPVMGSYVSVTPFRITDTRASSGQPNAGKSLAANSTLNVQVTRVGTEPVPAGTAAVVLNVTAVDPATSGFLTVFPEGITMPTVSNLNFSPGETVANLVTVPLSSSGMVSIYNHAGSTNVVVDVEGYYTSAPLTDGSGLYNSISPVRALGTLASGTAIGPNTSQAVTATGTSTGVPANATAVVVNATAAQGTKTSFLTVYPAGVTMPTASNVNFVADQVVANRVTVGVGTGGRVEVYNHTGTVKVDLDVDGYYTGKGGTGSAFVPITPVRLTDTRVPTNGTPIAANTSEEFNLSTTVSGIPTTVSAVAANITVVSSGAPGYLTVYPASDTTVPVASDVNWAAKGSPAVPNFTVAGTGGTGSVEVYNSHGATINLLIDAFGYFERQLPTSTTVSESPTSVTYGHESASVFSVTVTTHYGEAVPNGETVTVTVGSVTCKVALKSGKGTCTIADTALAVGTYPVSATYGGDASLNGSSGSSVSKLTVSKDTTSTTVSESPTSVTYGHESASVFSVTVTTHYGEAVPNGETVTVTVGSVTCKVALNSGKGTCTIADTALAVGTYPVSATYGGDASLNGSSGSSVSKLTVSKDTTSTTVSESPTSVTYGHESASVFSVTVTTHYGEAVPNGETVTVTVGSVTCKVALNSGKGTCTIADTALAVGTYPVSATYGGDASLNGSSGSSVSKLTV
jgi:predicted RNA-binding protein with TRAM domain